jgi:hypothetical protein
MVQPDRIIMPAAGRFGAAEAVVRRGFAPSQIYASDITLFTSVLGYLADPDRKLDDLGIEFHGEAEQFLDGSDGSELETAASVMLAIKHSQLPNSHQYGMNMRRELRTRIPQYRKRVVDEISELMMGIEGIHYSVADLREPILANVEDPTAGMYMNPPGYSPTAYVKMFTDQALTWTELRHLDEPWDEDALADVYRRLTGSPMFGVVFSIRGEGVPEDWHKLLAVAKKGGRIDYVVANRPLSMARVRTTHRTAGEVQHFEIYDDQEIIPGQTVLGFVEINRETGLYYRDLFIHRLGMTQAEFYVMMTLDGRAVTSIGLNREKLQHFYSEYIYETYGISTTSHRYKRLGKLFMMALCTTEFRHWLMRHTRVGIRMPKGMITTSLTKHAEGKTDRGVMKATDRELQSNGLWKITYKADFRDMTFDDALAEWFKQHGGRTRAKVPTGDQPGLPDAAPGPDGSREGELAGAAR